MLAGLNRALAEKSDLADLQDRHDPNSDASHDVQRAVLSIVSDLKDWRLASLCENASGEWYVGLEHRSAIEWQQKRYVSAQDKTISAALDRAIQKAKSPHLR